MSWPAPRLPVAERLRMSRAPLGLASVLILLTLLLTACTGDGEARAFRGAFADDPSVASMDLSSHDKQAFTGGVSGTVTTRRQLSDDQLTALVTRIAAYTEEHRETMRGRISVSADGFLFPVDGDKADDTATLHAVLALRKDPRTRSGRVSGSTVSVTTATGDDGVALTRALPRLLGLATPTRVWTMSIRSDDDDISLAEMRESDLQLALRLRDAVRQRVPLRSITGTPEVLTITTPAESDVPAARAVAEGTLGGADVRLRYQSDLVRLGTADGADARALLARLSPTDRARVSTIWAGETDLQLTTRDLTDLTALARPIRDAAGDESILLIAGTTTAELPRERSAIDGWARSLTRLTADGDVRELRATTRDVHLTVSRVPDAELGRFAADMKTLAEPGARVCIERPDDGICVTAADRVSLSSLNGYAQRHADAFVRAWNAVD